MHININLIKFILRIGLYYCDEDGYSSGYEFGSFFNIDNRTLFEHLQEMQLMGLVDDFYELDFESQYGHTTFAYRLSKRGGEITKDYHTLIEYLNKIGREEKRLPGKSTQQEVGKQEDSISTSCFFEDSKIPSVFVDRNFRILIGELELHLTPLCKVLYIFFLKHPEGVSLKQMLDFKQELIDIYKKVSRFDDQKRVLKSINDLTNPVGDSFSQKKSKINNSITKLLDMPMSDLYKIQGKRGEAFRISVPDNHIDLR